MIAGKRGNKVEGIWVRKDKEREGESGVKLGVFIGLQVDPGRAPPAVNRSLMSIFNPGTSIFGSAKML